MPSVPASGFADIVHAVLDALTTELGLPAGTVEPHTRLFDLPGFSSGALARVLDEVECRAGLELPEDRMVPDTFETPKSFAEALVGRPTNARPGGAV